MTENLFKNDWLAAIRENKNLKTVFFLHRSAAMLKKKTIPRTLFLQISPQKIILKQLQRQFWGFLYNIYNPSLLHWGFEYYLSIWFGLIIYVPKILFPSSAINVFQSFVHIARSICCRYFTYRTARSRSKVQELHHTISIMSSNRAQKVGLGYEVEKKMENVWEYWHLL